MQTSVTFKNIESSEHLKSYVKKKLDKLDKLLDNPAEAAVVLSVEKINHIAEIKLTGDRLNINCREKTGAMTQMDAQAPSEEEGNHPIIIQNIEYKPMDVEEASMQMDLIPDSFLVFTNSRTNRVNVLYRRKDGELGLIQPLS